MRSFYERARTAALVIVVVESARAAMASEEPATVQYSSAVVIAQRIEPGRPFMADSIGRVIIVSISSGAIASFSVTMVKTGIVMSG